MPANSAGRGIRQMLTFGRAILCLIAGHICCSPPSCRCAPRDIFRLRLLLRRWWQAGLSGVNYSFRSVLLIVARHGSAIPHDLYPAWYASRQVLFHHGDPYSAEVTRQVQIAMFGHTIPASDTTNQQRFAYPLYSVLLFAPFALLPFSAAQAFAFAAATVLMILSVFWWLPRPTTARTRRTLVIFLSASYPVVLGLQLRQPTMLIAPLLAAAVFCVRSNRLVLAVWRRYRLRSRNLPLLSSCHCWSGPWRSGGK